MQCDCGVSPTDHKRTGMTGIACSVLTATPIKLCQFRQVNCLIAGALAPTANLTATITTSTVNTDMGAVTVV